MPFPYPKIIDLLVPRLCLVTQIMRLCLQFLSREAEPLDIASQAEPGNQLDRTLRFNVQSRDNLK